MEYGLVVVWLVAYVALGALALPLAAALLSRFPDDGAGFAVPVAFVVLFVVGFWVGRLAFGWPALVAGVSVLAVLSYLAVRRGADPDLRRFGETMTVFAVAFLFLVAVRALDPAVHPGGGEKFLDFGLLSVLVRAPRLPPEDFWFAGDPVQYYYGGHMIAALLVRLTGTTPRFAYNLALPGFYAAFVTAAYSLAGAVASQRSRSRVSAGVFAAFFVAVASNLATPVRALAWSLGSAAPAQVFGLAPNWATTRPQDFSYWTASRVIPLGAIEIPTEFPLFAYLNGDMHAHMMSPPLLLLLAAVGFAYWRTPAPDLTRRRLLAFVVAPLVAGTVATVNNWSYPTTAGVTWLALALAPSDPRHLLPGVGPSPTDNRHDPATAAGTSDGTSRLGRRLVDEGSRAGSALLVAVVVALAAGAVAGPLLLRTTSGRGVGFVAPERRTSLAHLLVIHGVFLALAARLLVGRLVTTYLTGGASRRNAVAALAAAGVVVALASLVTLLTPAIAGVRPAVLGVVPFVLVIAVGWVLLRTDGDTDPSEDGGVGYETALMIGAAGLVTIVEFVYVTDTGAGRYNTVFKTYSQVWALSAVAGGVLLAEYADPVGYLRGTLPSVGGSRRTGVATDGGTAETGPPDPESDRSGRTARSAVSSDGTGSGRGVPSVGGVLAAALVVTLSVYGAFALAGHVEAADRRGPATLDALRFAERDHSLEWPAIRYVRSLEGTPTIVTAPAEQIYRWAPDYRIRQPPPDGSLAGGAAPSSLSGVPTLAGWIHEVGYRGSAAWNDRVADVNAIYAGPPEQQARLLDEHDVQYVYVGPAERSRYPEGTLAFDDRLAGVSVVPESRDWEVVTIYRVDQDELGVADASASVETDSTDDSG